MKTTKTAETKIWVGVARKMFIFTAELYYTVSFFVLDVDSSLSPNCKSTNTGVSRSGVERMLEFGRELFQMSQRLEKEQGANETNQKMLEVSFGETETYPSKVLLPMPLSKTRVTSRCNQLVLSCRIYDPVAMGGLTLLVSRLLL